MPSPINQPVMNKSQIAATHIKHAADKTGVDFNYLLQTAQRESAFDPNAKAKTSSATGLFQFVKQTWYETLNDFGDKHGYADYTQYIKRDENGRYFVPNKQAKNAILELRKDPRAASLMAAEFSKQNMQYLQGKIGREPKASELYMAHFMGRGAAAKLINLQQTNPNAAADQYFPKHAAANKPIFYSHGKPRSIAQVYDNLAKHHVELAESKGLDPNNIEDVAKLVPFLTSNDGFFGSLFGHQTAQSTNIKPIAFSGMGTSNAVSADNQLGQLNTLLLAQIAGQNQTVNNQQALPLPEALFSQQDNASLANKGNFFSLKN